MGRPFALIILTSCLLARRRGPRLQGLNPQAQVWLSQRAQQPVNQLLGTTEGGAGCGVARKGCSPGALSRPVLREPLGTPRAEAAAAAWEKMEGQVGAGAGETGSSKSRIADETPGSCPGAQRKHPRHCQGPSPKRMKKRRKGSPEPGRTLGAPGGIRWQEETMGDSWRRRCPP